MSMILLNELNAARIARNLPPFADWRKARHQPLLDQYRAEDAAAAALAEQEAKKNARKAKRKGEKDPNAVPPYKRMPHGIPSTIESPVAFVHAFLNDNPHLKRKAAVNALVQKGINFSTARTQYQRWSANRKGA